MGSATPARLNRWILTPCAPRRRTGILLPAGADLCGGRRGGRGRPFQYGEGIDALPEIPAKKGCFRLLAGSGLHLLTASQTLEAEYTPYTSALTDGGELPEILVDGSFSSRAQVSHTTEEVAWTDGGAEYAGTAYTVTVEDRTWNRRPTRSTAACRTPASGTTSGC